MYVLLCCLHSICRFLFNYSIKVIVVLTTFSIIFGIGRFITNQQNIYKVTPVHYLQKAEKKT